MLPVDTIICLHSTRAKQKRCDDVMLSKQERSTMRHLANAQYEAGPQVEKLDGFFTPQPLRAVGVLFSPMVSGWAGCGKKFVRAVSQKP